MEPSLLPYLLPLQGGVTLFSIIVLVNLKYKGDIQSLYKNWNTDKHEKIKITSNPTIQRTMVNYGFRVSFQTFLHSVYLLKYMCVYIQAPGQRAQPQALLRGPIRWVGTGALLAALSPGPRQVRGRTFLPGTSVLPAPSWA